MSSARSAFGVATRTSKALGIMRLERPPPTRSALKKHFAAIARQSHPDAQPAAAGAAAASGMPAAQDSTMKKMAAPQQVGAAPHVVTDMAVLTDAYATLQELYDRETGALRSSSFMAGSAAAASGRPSPSSSSGPGGARFHDGGEGYNPADGAAVTPPAYDPQAAGRMWFPWQRRKPASLSRHEASEQESSILGRAAKGVRGAALNASEAVRRTASRTRAAVHFIITGR